MQTSSREATTEQPRDTHRGDHSGALALVAIGLFLLLAQLFDLGVWALPVLGIGFLLFGIVACESGWLIPGGILSGISLGIFLVEGPYRVPGGDAEGGLFLLAFALGWFSIAVLSALFTRERHWWALIPGSNMALNGLAVLGGGIWATVLSFLGNVWPLGLVAAGVYTLYRQRHGRE